MKCTGLNLIFGVLISRIGLNFISLLMKKLILPFLIVFLSLTGVGFIAQENPLDTILRQLEKYRDRYPQEKVHLHLDKPYYAIGDNIWFKAYLVDAATHELSSISRILYVELINEKDSVKQSLRLPVTGGLTWGDFALSDTLQEGNYRIRAYTTWMRNFGDEYFFDKTIQIGNSISNSVLTEVSYKFIPEGNNEKVEAAIRYTNLAGEPFANKPVSYSVELDFRSLTKGKTITNSSGVATFNFVNNQPFVLKAGKIITRIQLNEKLEVSKTVLVKATNNDVDLQFFPESGNLIYGVRSKVAFKALGSDGLGKTVAGIVFDQNGAEVAKMSSEHAGMGYFAMRPEEGSTYTAKVTFDDGSENTYPLPKPLTEGYAILASTRDSANLAVQVAVSPGVTDTGSFTLIAQANGRVYYASKSTLDKTLFGTTIPKSRFPTGIVQLTLFSPKNQPVAERLLFINHSDQLVFEISASQPASSKREKVKLLINAKTAAGRPVNGSFSVSVIDETKVPFKEVEQTTILSNLLLTSDLKGYVEQPNYYFTDVDEKKQRHLDILMLTQGWRRFVWKNVLSNNFPALAYQPEKNLQISGTITANNGDPVAGGKVTLFSSQGDVLLIDTVTDRDGRFVFENLFFNDSTKFVVQARNEKNRRKVQIELDGLAPQLVTKNKNAADRETNMSSSFIKYLINSRDQYAELRKYGLVNSSILLAEVKIVETKPLVKNSSNLNGAGQADNILTEKDLRYGTSLAQILQGRVAGIIIRNGIAYSMRSMGSSFNGPVPMQIIMDGMYVQPEFLNSINPQDVESIEVLKSGANTPIYGLRGGGGVLVINTKRGERNLAYNTYAAGIVSFKPQGLYTSREFYSPNYDDPKINTKIADLRTTLFWSPSVITDTTGLASVEYFNGDATGTYAVIIEGISVKGEIGRSVYRYHVN